MVCTATEAFDFACGIEDLPDKIQSLQRVITGLLAQTTELCIFVRHYTSRRIFGMHLHLYHYMSDLLRTIDQFFTLNDSSEKIRKFKEYFRMIKSEFTAPLALQTASLAVQIAFVSARISEEVKTTCTSFFFFGFERQ